MLKVLMAPLDWGLGHATRCIPIIKGLVDQHCTVIIAADGAQKAALQKEFPDLSFVKTPGFRLKYGKNRAITLLKIIFAIPKILIGIKRENRWLRHFAGQERLDLVISDSRYGLYGRGFVSVFITHQLAIRSSFGGLVDGLLRRLNYGYIRRFSACWVPDVEGEDSLGGLLSHPSRMPEVPTRYIGWLSRMDKIETPLEVDLLILLSGPEPQRTVLEELLLPQLGEMGRVILVRGLPRGGSSLLTPGGVEVIDYLGARDLEKVINQSRSVVARSGYSTIMDLVKLGKTAIYVPTPGQPEQEYLGRYMEERGLGICMRQRGFMLKTGLEKVGGLKNGPAMGENTALALVIGEVLAMARRQSGASPSGAQSAVADLG